MRICLATSEVHPFSKTGGLADVAAALSRHLHLQGNEVRILTPLYATASTTQHSLKPDSRLKDIPVSLGPWNFRFSVLSCPLPGSELKVSFIHCPALYDRPAVYTADADEHLRFLLLTRAVFECCLRWGWAPDVIHCNDWQTALAPLLKRAAFHHEPLFSRTKTVLTIHNVGYQGIFSAGVREAVLPREHDYLLHQDDLRSGVINFLKTGILYADALTTVSPTYAREIQNGELGAGLEELLRSRSDSLHGILNGVDYDEWSPQKDAYIEKNYDARNPVAGKSRNKQALLTQLGLACGERTPLVAVISRLVGQKGFDLLFDSLPGLLQERDFLFVALGSGEKKYRDFFQRMQSHFPSRVCFYDGYNNELAHMLEAAADMLLMPSRYEPCGLNQMYSLKYGTVPVVRKTGGLADTVQHWDPETRTGNGFVFEHFTPEGLRWALGQALDVHQDRRSWLKLMRNGMASNFSWTAQAGKYIDLYRQLSSGAGRTPALQ